MPQYHKYKYLYHPFKFSLSTRKRTLKRQERLELYTIKIKEIMLTFLHVGEVSLSSLVILVTMSWLFQALLLLLLLLLFS